MIPLRRRRILAQSMAVMFGLALLAAANHQATAVHGYCTEHGERIHLGHHAHRSATTGGSGVTPQQVVCGVHDCAYLSFLAQSFRPPLDRAERLISQARDRVHATPQGTVPPAIPLLLQSPKVSPPAV